MTIVINSEKFWKKFPEIEYMDEDKKIEFMKEKLQQLGNLLN